MKYFIFLSFDHLQPMSLLAKSAHETADNLSLLSCCYA